MQIDVYPTDAEASDAAAAAVAEALRAGRGRLCAAVSGARSSRAVVVALGARTDLPWERIEWLVADERVGEGEGAPHARALRDGLFAPRAVTAARQHAPVPLDDAATMAREYATTVTTVLGDDGRCDVVLLGIDSDGRLGVLDEALVSAAEGLVVAVPGDAPGDRGWVSITPAMIDRARRVVVTALGPETADAVATALRDGRGGGAGARPSDRVHWIVDRDAAATLLADASVVEPPSR